MVLDAENVRAIGLQKRADHAQHRVERRAEGLVLQHADAFDVEAVRPGQELERFLLALVVGDVERDLEARLAPLPIDELVAQQVVMRRDRARVLPLEERVRVQLLVRAERARGGAILQHAVAQMRAVVGIATVNLLAGFVHEQQLVGVGVADVHEFGQSVEKRIHRVLHAALPPSSRSSRTAR